MTSEDLSYYADSLLLWQGVAIRVTASLGSLLGVQKVWKCGAFFSTAIKVFLYTIYGLQFAANVVEAVLLLMFHMSFTSIADFKHCLTLHMMHSSISLAVIHIGIAANLSLTSHFPLLSGKASTFTAVPFVLVAVCSYYSALLSRLSYKNILHVVDYLNLMFISLVVFEVFVLRRHIKGTLQSSNQQQRFVLKGAYRLRRNLQMLNVLNPIFWMSWVKAVVSTVVDYGMVNAEWSAVIYGLTMDHPFCFLISLGVFLKFLRVVLEARREAFVKLQNRDYEARLTYNTTLPVWDERPSSQDQRY